MSRNVQFLIMYLTVFLSGCTKFTSLKQPADPSFFMNGEDSLTPSTDKLAAPCFGQSAFDACLYLKNPVAQEKGAVPHEQAESKRRFGVKIRGLVPTGFLENSRVQIYALNSPRFTLQSRVDLKTEGKPEAAAQFSAYYWSNRMFDYLGARVGQERLPLRGLKIYADDAFTGYSAVNGSVHLEKKDNQIAKAFSGEIVVHLTAQAVAHAISGGRLFAKDSTQHNFCALDPKGCCATEMGCAQALGNGFGEYTAAMMFPDSARTGETLSGAIEGQKICSIPRDLNSLSARTKTQVFNACDPKGRAVLLGAWYASIWWKLRAQLEAQETGAGADVDKIFFDHAKSFTGQSTFSEAKAAAMSVVLNYKAGKYSAAFTAAFSAAGI